MTSEHTVETPGGLYAIEMYRGELKAKLDKKI